MLHRAANNAYSWWWASHIRTKQTKWVEQSLQDMEQKVTYVLKLIEEDGDSFARRAEMYYKKRPELISFVEESYRAYRALAERYDHISTELQNANNTIASCFPEQVPFMDEDDDDGLPGTPRASRKMPEGLKPNIPKVPNAPHKEFKSFITAATKKFNTRKTTAGSPNVPKSGLSREELRAEIDKIQKQILTLQTVKEFIKSTYDNTIAKYWETEEQIKELQERVSILQDEYGEGVVIEDNEARRLMAEAALKSCQETLTQLQEKREKSVDETRISNTRIKEIRERLEALMHKFNYDQSNQREPRAKRTLKGVEEKGPDDDGIDRMSQQRQELQLLQEKIEEHFNAGFHSSLSVSEMAEKIDELVNKVVSLETAVSSQTALVKRLRSETDELQSQVQTLEDDKVSLIKDKADLNNKLREMEEKMHGVQDLNQMVEDHNNNLLTHFTEAQCNLDHLSEKVQHVKEDGDIEVNNLSQTKWKSSGEAKSEYGIEAQDALDKYNGSKLVNNGKSDEEHKLTSLVENEVKLDKEIKVSGLAENDMQSDKEPKVTRKPENDVKSDREIKISGLGQNDVKSDEEPNVTSMAENDVKSDNEPKVSSSAENDVKSDNQPKVTSSAENDVKSDMEIEISGLGQNDVKSDKEPKVTSMAENDVKSDKDFKVTRLAENDVKSEKKPNVTTLAENDVKSDMETKISGLGQNDVKPDEEPKVTSMAEDDVNSDKDLQVTSLAENDVKSDIEIKISGLGQNNVKPGEEPKVTSMAKDDVKSDNDLKVASLAEDVKSNKEPKVTGVAENDVKSDKDLKDTSLAENDVKSDKEPEVTASPENEKASTAKNKHSTELQQEEKASNQGEIDGISRDSLSANAGNKDASQFSANKQTISSLESSGNQQHIDAKQISSEKENTLQVHSQRKEANQEDEPDWRQLFMDGMKDREKVLLMEYTNTLRSYKDVKKQLAEVKKNQNSLSDMSLLLEQLRASNALKDEEIKLLLQKLSLLQNCLQGIEGSAELRLSVLPAQNQDIEAMLKIAQSETSAIEERFRANIDEILEENLEFWLKFSTTFNEIQKFDTTIKDLQTDISNLEEKGKSSEASSSIKHNLKSDAWPIYKHLSEIQAELTVWLEKSILLKDELKRRSSSLCNIQEEITKAVKDSAEDDDFKFTSYQAAKFQGEVLNMKNENNKVADEIQAGLDHMTNLQLEVEKALAKLNDQFGLESSKREQTGQLRQLESRHRVPLGAFIFGVKPKREHRSIFACMSPRMHRKYRGLRGQSYT